MIKMLKIKTELVPPIWDSMFEREINLVPSVIFNHF